MALSTSPRKVVPLAGGEDWEARPAAPPSFTRRVFFCGVVVESSGHGRGYSQDVQDLVASLGEPLEEADLTTSTRDSVYDAESVYGPPTPRKRAMTNASALTSVITELVNTERSYVHRLHMLKREYADPLRTFARNKDTAILPPYEAKTLFGNIDNLLPVNEAFLADLERMLQPDGPTTVGGVGEIALRHFRDLRGFDHYKQYYVKREEAQSIFEREMSKKSSGFAAFVDRIKYSTDDIKNRIGLRELLMDPVQRIPRYTLMFRTMIKHMAPSDPQYSLLEQADEIASKIALAEMDEQTKRAAVIHCLCATVDNFPPALISNSRRFIDCIDAEDHMPESQLVIGGNSSSLNAPLHCSLFLFDDKLMIVKRPGNGEKSGRALAGLDELEKMTKSGGLPLGMKKSGMTCKGVVEITDIVATDAGPSSIHLYIENPPLDESERWSGRALRSLTVVFPPSPANLVPTKAEAAKHRFLERLWEAQARYRTKLGQSVALRAEESEVEARRGKVTVARTYFNVYQRTAFLKEAKKTKVVLHIDELGSSDPLPFGVDGPPFVIVRVQPMAGLLARYTVTSSDPNDEGEEDIVQTSRVPSRIVQTIHQFGLFKFRTGMANSIPATPTASSRSRAAIFNLDAISRNLFNARPGIKGDIFSGSLSGHRRVKSTTSRSSASTNTTTTGDGSLTKWSSRTSNSTVATSVSAHTADDDFVSVSSSKPRSLSRGRRLIKRGKSPSTGDEMNGLERVSSRQSNDSQHSPSGGDTVFGEDDSLDDMTMEDGSKGGSSEWDLTRRLALARQNSENQFASSPSPLIPPAPLYEDPPEFARPLSRASKEAPSQRSVTPRPYSPGPVRSTSSLGLAVTTSLDEPSRPLGPRSPSPLPSSRSPLSFLPATPLEIVRPSPSPAPSEPPDVPPKPASTPPRVLSPLPRSRRMPFEPMINTDATPKASTSRTGAGVEPLSIKKKPSVNAGASPGSARKVYGRNSVLARVPSQGARSPTRSPPRTSRVVPLSLGDGRDESADRLAHLVEKSKEGVDSSYRAVKRIKVELEKLQSAVKDEEVEEYRSTSPIKAPTRIPSRAKPPPTKAAQERMEEMKRLIARREETTQHTRQRSFPDNSAEPVDSAIRTLDELVTDAERDLSYAAATQELLLGEVQKVAADMQGKSAELGKVKVELKNSKRQCELVKSLLADATAEKEIMYEAFNEELDGMYNDITLPEDEAWTAMTTDLRQTKEEKHVLSKENSLLKRKLAEMESEREEWEELLRSHGLIS